MRTTVTGGSQGIGPTPTTPIGEAKPDGEAILAALPDSLTADLSKRDRLTLLLAEASRNPGNLWWPGRPLGEARHAHRTNTREEFEAALNNGSNFFEGDVRSSLTVPGKIEMRHDPVLESGHTLSLEEWLKLGVASGRGLKLDIKEPDQVPGILEALKASGLDQGRLMINLGADAMAQWGPELRRQFPQCILAINPPAGKGTTLDDTQVKAVLDQAATLGMPITFVVRFDQLTPQVLARLQAVGPVSVWNAEDTPVVKDPGGVAKAMKAMGVQGEIDIRRTRGTLDKVAGLLDRAKNEVRTWLARHLHL